MRFKETLLNYSQMSEDKLNENLFSVGGYSSLLGFGIFNTSVVLVASKSAKPEKLQCCFKVNF